MQFRLQLPSRINKIIMGIMTREFFKNNKKEKIIKNGLPSIKNRIKREIKARSKSDSSSDTTDDKINRPDNKNSTTY